MATKRVSLTRPEYRGIPFVKESHGQKRGDGEEPYRGSSSPPLSPFVSHAQGREPTPAREGDFTVNELLDFAGKLTVSERQALLDRLALNNLDDGPAASDRDLNIWSQAIYNALVESLGGEDRAEVGLMVVRRVVGARSSWAPIVDFMKSTKFADLTVAERQAVYRMLAKLLVDHARGISRRSGAPMGPKLVGSCAGSIRGVFERSFPGYLSAGLAHIVARRLCV